MSRHLAVELSAQQSALVELLRYLKQHHYHFTTITPLSHQRILTRRKAQTASSLTDIFGWNLPFDADFLPLDLFALLQTSQYLERYNDQQWYSCIRVSSLDQHLVVHSGYPTQDIDAVFFGPDTYRFYFHVQQYLQQQQLKPKSALEIGCGTAAVAIALAKQFKIEHMTGIDINPQALSFSAVNAKAAKMDLILAQSDVLQDIDQKFDFIFANPPYLVDDEQRQYRHGGQLDGAEMAFVILQQAIRQLSPQGHLFLYTGAAISQDNNLLYTAIKIFMQDYPDYSWHYQEIDPDVFGEELEHSQYQHIDRISLALITVQAP